MSSSFHPAKQPQSCYHHQTFLGLKALSLLLQTNLLLLWLTFLHRRFSLSIRAATKFIHCGTATLLYPAFSISCQASALVLLELLLCLLLSLYRSLSVSHLSLSCQSPGLVISCVWVKPFRCGFHFLFDFGSYLSLTFCFLIVCTCILFFPRVLIAVFLSLLCASIC